jgi:hypothetical protein
MVGEGGRKMGPRRELPGQKDVDDGGNDRLGGEDDRENGALNRPKRNFGAVVDVQRNGSDGRFQFGLEDDDRWCCPQ